MIYCYGRNSPTETGHKCLIGDFWISDTGISHVYNKFGQWEVMIDESPKPTPFVPLGLITDDDRFDNAMEILDGQTR